MQARISSEASRRAPCLWLKPPDTCVGRILLLPIEKDHTAKGDDAILVGVIDRLSIVTRIGHILQPHPGERSQIHLPDFRNGDGDLGVLIPVRSAHQVGFRSSLYHHGIGLDERPLSHKFDFLPFILEHVVEVDGAGSGRASVRINEIRLVVMDSHVGIGRD